MDHSYPWCLDHSSFPTRLYAEKLEQFKKELSELEAGTHPALCEKLKALEHERDQQLFRINTIAQTRVKHVDNQYDLERTMAQEELDVCFI